MNLCPTSPALSDSSSSIIASWFGACWTSSEPGMVIVHRAWTLSSSAQPSFLNVFGTWTSAPIIPSCPSSPGKRTTFGDPSTWNVTSLDFWALDAWTLTLNVPRTSSLAENLSLKVQVTVLVLLSASQVPPTSLSLSLSSIPWFAFSDSTSGKATENFCPSATFPAYQSHLTSTWLYCLMGRLSDSTLTLLIVMVPACAIGWWINTLVSIRHTVLTIA